MSKQMTIWGVGPKFTVFSILCFVLALVVHHGMFRGPKRAEKVESGFWGVFPAFYRESQAKSGIDLLEMNRSKQLL
jgi:hypothetical protein